MKSSFLAWMQRLLLSTSVLLITILVTQTIPCLAQTRDEIESLCDQLEEAVQNQSIEEIRRLFRVGNATTLEQTLASYEELIEGSDSLSFEIQVMSVQEAEEVAHVTWQRRIHAGTGEKEHLDVTWWRISVASTTDGIRILREEPIAHAKAIWTDLAVRLEPESGRMEGTATVRCELLTGSVDALVFSLNRGPKITGLTDSIGAVPAYRRVGTAVVIPIASDLAPGEQVTFHFGFAGKLFNATAEFGYSNVHIGPEGSYASWLSSWYPQLMGESPGSPGAIRISVPAGLTAVSNGRAGPVVDHGEWREFSFHVEQPLSYSFAAADYYHKSTELDGVSVGVYLLQENVEKADLYIERTTEILDYLWHSIYGMYPYTNFWIVEMPGRVAGRTAGSAEQGLAFFPDYSLGSQFFNDAVISHEMGHSWWGTWVIGNGVLMSEGLAQLTYALAMEHLYGEEIMWRYVTHGTEDYFQAASEYFSRVAQDPSADQKLGINRWDQLMDLHRFFNTKAHFVFLMLRDEIGQEAFYRGMRQALAKYAGTRMTLEQLQGEWELASGTNLKWFFSQWFYRTGAPEFNLEYSVGRLGDKYLVEGEITQNENQFDCTMELQVANGDTSKSFELKVNGPRTPFSFRTDFEPTEIALDPDYRIFRWTESFRDLGPFGEGFENLFAGNFELGAEQMTSYVEKHPDDLMARTWLATTLYHFLRKSDPALNHFSYVIEHGEPEGVYVLYQPTAAIMTGNIYDSRGNREQAIRCYELAITLDRTGRFERQARRYLVQPFQPLPPLRRD